MTIQEIVDKAEGGLVEVPRLDWLALLKGIKTVADTVHARWLTDLIFGAETPDFLCSSRIDAVDKAVHCAYKNIIIGNGRGRD